MSPRLQGAASQRRANERKRRDCSVSSAILHQAACFVLYQQNTGSFGCLEAPHGHNAERRCTRLVGGGRVIDGRLRTDVWRKLSEFFSPVN